MSHKKASYEGQHRSHFLDGKLSLKEVKQLTLGAQLIHGKLEFETRIVIDA